MKRREFIAALGGAAAWPLVARGQSRSVARVGFLSQAGPDDKHFDAFRNGLRAAGYVEDRNMFI
jgi:putative tryptophan/tyrosine transport system substrate-binding protein